MQVEFNEIEPCKLAVHCEAGAEEILNKRATVLDAFRKAPVPGNRPGKASLDAIKMHYKDQIEESLKRTLAESAFHEAIFVRRLRPHGAPRFNSAMLADGKFTCDFELFTKPDFELATYKDLEIPKPHETHTTDQVTEMLLQELRVRFGDVLPYGDGDFVQKGDKVILDYEGSVDGQKVDNLSSTGDMVTVGTSQLPAFDDNILGMNVGETREFDIVVPAHGLPSLSGKIVHLKVTLNMGSKTSPCTLDDTLAQKLNKKDMDELREFVHQMAGARVAQAQQIKVNEAVANRLVADHNVNVPGWMTLSEAQYLAHQSKMDWNALPDPDRERFLVMAERNVKLSLILDKIKEEEPSAQLTDQEVFEIIKRNLANTKVDKPIDDVMKEMQRTGYLQILFSRIREEYALDFIVKSVKLID